MNLLIVSDRSEKESGTDFLANRFKEQFGADVLYTRSNNESTRFIDRIFNKINIEIDKYDVNARIRNEILKKKYDAIIIWKGNRVFPSTLKFIKKYSVGTLVCAWCGDNMTKWMNKSIFFHLGLKYYDAIFTVNIPSYKGISSYTDAKIYYYDKRADKYLHKRSHFDKSEYLYEILFIGTYERQRYSVLDQLARAGHKVTVYGNNWNKVSRKAHENLDIKFTDITGEMYSEVISKSKIVLGFLRKKNEDTQTSRTFEIPACGSFMLMERSADHTRLFVEGLEAEFFDSNKELIDKINFYLVNEERRESIASAGRKRVESSGYFFDDLAIQITNDIRVLNESH